MKTKDLIKMLQEEDPSGEGHVRMGDGGVTWYAEGKPGYYDGSYQYLDEDGNFVTSTQGYKIDLRGFDLYDFIERHEDESWEDLKKRFVFDIGNHHPQRQEEKKERLLKRAKKEYDDMKQMRDQLYQKSFEEMLINADKGWTWFQNKGIDGDMPGMHYHYTWKIFDENDKSQGSNIHNTESIVKSGEWTRVDNNVMENHYQWIKK